MMLEDAKKCKNNILEHDQIQFAPLYDENEEFIEIDNLDDLLK